MSSSLVDGPHLDSLIAKGSIRSYPKNALLIQEGDRSDQLYVVISGHLKVFLSDSKGKEIVIDTLGPRQCFGEMALDGEARSASVMTTEPCQLAVIERDQFKAFLAADPEAAFALIVTLIGRARNLTRAIGSLALLDVYGRVARLLLDSATEENGTLIVGERMTQQEIANRVGSSRETVSRIITDLRQGGYLGLEKNRIVVYRRLPKRW